MKYSKKIEKRAINHGRLMLERNATIRSVAEKTNNSKTMVHLDVTVRLHHINYNLYLAVQEKLSHNKSERHLRGGEGNRLKHLKNKNKKGDA